MTIREYLYRRWCRSLCAILGTVALLVLTTIVASCTRWLYFDIPLLAAALAASWLPYLTMRCPRCRVHLSGNGITRGLFATGQSARFNRCPGCGVDLESPA